MQIIRTVVWVVLLAALLLFSAFNWKPVEVKIWEGLVLETKIPALVLISFLIGLLPMWLLHWATKWSLKRRIGSLERRPQRGDESSRASRTRTRSPRPSRQRRAQAPPAVTSPIYLALDLPQLDDARALADRVKSHVGGLKLGLEFFCAHGHHGVHEIAHVGLPIFLDLKLHDILTTVAGAMQAIHVLEPAIVTVHASGGRAMMEDAKGRGRLLHQGRRGDHAHQPR